ncbi:hypothetical protein BGZ82_011475, partial [Podila clonocystis]
MPEYSYKIGWDRLRRLAQVQDVWFPTRVFEKLTVADVGWMTQHWPQLKTVRTVSGGDIRRLPEVMNAFVT